jgi:hypothetical protein
MQLKVYYSRKMLLTVEFKGFYPFSSLVFQCLVFRDTVMLPTQHSMCNVELYLRFFMNLKLGVLLRCKACLVHGAEFRAKQVWTWGTRSNYWGTRSNC